MSCIPRGREAGKDRALNNNIAALKAERINILAPVPGKSSWASKCELIKTK